MKQFIPLSVITRIILIATAIFLMYGYLCRLFKIYFFWESKTIGWTLFWIAAVLILRDRIKHQKFQNKKILLEKIGIGLCTFSILLKGILFFVIPETSAFEKATNFIKTNPEIRNKVGAIKGIFVVPFGGMSMSTTEQGGSAGQADLYFVVKGSDRYIDLNLLMSKDFQTDWQIEMSK